METVLNLWPLVTLVAEKIRFHVCQVGKGILLNILVGIVTIWIPTPKILSFTLQEQPSASNLEKFTVTIQFSKSDNYVRVFIFKLFQF
jgi:hypothetical protein